MGWLALKVWRLVSQCVYIRDDLESYMPFNPIINTSPENITENLRILIEDERLRKE